MISQETFVELMHGLGEDLVSPDGRREAVYRRVRRVRRRRAALTVAASVIVVAGIVVALAPWRSPVPPQQTAVTTMAASWIADDGVTYRRVAVKSLDTVAGRSLTVRLPASNPVAVVATCDPSGFTLPPGATPGELPEISVRIGSATDLHTIECGQVLRPGLIDYDVAGASNPDGTVTLTLTGAPVGYLGLPDQAFPAHWTFGFYTWQIPATLRPAPVLPAMPHQQNGYVLQTTKAGIWPQRSVSFHLPKGVTWGVFVTCSGAFAGSEWDPMYGDWHLTVDGQPAFYTPCRGDERVAGAATPLGWPQPIATTTKAITITVTFGYDKMYDLRSGSWLVGLYYRTAQ